MRRGLEIIVPVSPLRHGVPVLIRYIGLALAQTPTTAERLVYRDQIKRDIAAGSGPLFLLCDQCAFGIDHSLKVDRAFAVLDTCNLGGAKCSRRALLTKTGLRLRL